ncbi:MAG: hypothetical protein ABI721_05385 [Candidatus Dojkabacteria bacterium]
MKDKFIFSKKYTAPNIVASGVFFLVCLVTFAFGFYGLNNLFFGAVFVIPYLVGFPVGIISSLIATKWFNPKASKGLYIINILLGIIFNLLLGLVLLSIFFVILDIR